MSIQLTVIHDFGNHVRGDVITSKDDVEAILGSVNQSNVVKVAAPDAPAAQIAKEA
jgi:hypothetical protein